MPGELHVHTDFHSEFLFSGRTLVVYTPPGYKRDTRRRYPLLLLHDGQNVFDPSTSYVPGEHWRAKETADDLLARRRIEPLVICAVYHGGARRLFEYTPTRSRKLDGGGSALHARMVVEELLPWLRARYRLSPQARHTAAGGSSLGGLVSLWLGLEHPAVFGKLLVMSPSVWWDGRWILKRLAGMNHASRQRLWVDIGSEEADKHQGSVRDARLLKATLASKGWREGRNLHYLEAEGGRHTEESWAARLPAALEFLFPRKARA